MKLASGRFNDQIDEITKSKTGTEDKHHAVTFEEVEGAFFLLFLGLFLSIFLLFIEIIINVIKKLNYNCYA